MGKSLEYLIRVNCKIKDNMKHKAILFDFIGVLLKQKDGYKQEKLVQEIDDKIGQITNDRLFKSGIIA